MNTITDEKFIEICLGSLSMAEACSKTGLQFSTFKRRALKLNCYNPNQAGKGINKKPPKKYDLDDIFDGKYPQYQSNKLRNRLIKDNIKSNQCEKCNNSTWLDMPIKLELHHKDGNKYNNNLNNLELLCPNCHSYTDTYKGKNVKKVT